jgi:hypothetical protein
MSENTIWLWLGLGAATGLYFFYKQSKRSAGDNAPSLISLLSDTNEEKSILLGGYAPPKDDYAARARIEQLISEAKSKSQEYKWQYQDTRESDDSLHQLSLAHAHIVNLLEYKKNNLSYNDEKIRLARRNAYLNELSSKNTFDEIDRTSNKGFQYLKRHPITSFFEIHLHDDNEFQKLKEEAKQKLGLRLFLDARKTIEQAKKAKISDPNIEIIENELSALGSQHDFKMFKGESSLSEIRKKLREAELKALSTNRATVHVISNLHGHDDQTKFRNAHEAFQNVQRGLYIPQGSKITCYVDDLYGRRVTVFTAQTDWHGDLSGPSFESIWRP